MIAEHSANFGSLPVSREVSADDIGPGKLEQHVINRARYRSWYERTLTKAYQQIRALVVEPGYWLIWARTSVTSRAWFTKA